MKAVVFGWSYAAMGVLWAVFAIFQYLRGFGWGIGFGVFLAVGHLALGVVWLVRHYRSRNSQAGGTDHFSSSSAERPARDDDEA